MSTFSPSTKEPDTPASETRVGGDPTGGFLPVRLRTFIIGIIAVIGVCLIVAFAELVASRGGSIDAVLLGATHMPPAAIGILIVLLFANALVKRISYRLRLNSAELAVIYFMLVCAALLSSFGLTAELLPNMVGVNYFANPQNHWQETFYHNIPSWLVPWDPSGPERQFVSVRFYEGLRQGEHVPWGNWIVPVCAWLVFGFLLFFLMACVTTLFRRQWVDNEKLTFPLVQLPMEMMNEETNTAFFKNKLMWLGFAFPAIIHGLNGLHNAFPSIPAVQSTFVLNSLFTTPPLNQMIFTPLVLAFSIIGFAYLLPLDVSFSFWFFLLFFRFQDFIALSLGHKLDLMPLYGGSRLYQGYQSAGAFVSIAIAMVWLAKPHLRLVKERILGGGKNDIDRNEYMGYRTAFWGGIIAMFLIMFWLKLAGVSFFIGFFMVFVFVFIVMLVLTRCVSEVGLLMLQPAFRPIDIWAVGAPRSMVGAQNLTILSFVNGIFFRDPRNVMPAFMDSMKGADGANASRRMIGIGALLAVGIGAFAAVMIQLWVVYTHGGLHMNSWFFLWNPPLYWNESYQFITNPNNMDYEGLKWFTRPQLIWFSMGSASTAVLYIMRARFWWWPFHPLGYAMGCAWPSVVYWSSFFVGWLLKSLILRYGGATSFKRFRPFFLGLILGEFATGIIWALISGLFKLASPAIPIS